MEISRTVALLDEVRGVLYSRSNTGDPYLAPVSTLLIHHALASRSISTDTRHLLDLLLELRDVQDLPRGYWLPVSTRSVPCGECALLVSGAPTEFLRRDYGIAIQGLGLGRLTIGSPSPQPHEPLQRWLNAPISTVAWCEDTLRQAKFGDHFGWKDLFLYDHWTPRSPSRWLSAERATPPDEPVLARSVHNGTTTGHYLLPFRNGAPCGMHEFPRGFDSRRFALAMLRRAGNGLGFWLTKQDAETDMLECPYLPSQESRLLMALGPVHDREIGIRVHLPCAATPAIQDVLQTLGLRQWSRQDD